MVLNETNFSWDRYSRGDFPLPFGIQHTGSDYGSMANDYPAIGVMGKLDMLFVVLVGYGKSPLLW